MEITQYEMRATFANNLSILRNSHHRPLSQKALARVLKLSPYAVNSYESCRAAPTAFAVYQVSAYFGIPMEQLLTMTITQRKDEEIARGLPIIKETDHGGA